jgi:hypothetical protein
LIQDETAPKHRQLGSALLEAKHPVQATRVLKQVTRMVPDCWASYTLLGDTLTIVALIPLRRVGLQSVT